VVSASLTLTAREHGADGFLQLSLREAGRCLEVEAATREGGTRIGSSEPGAQAHWQGSIRAEGDVDEDELRAAVASLSLGLLLGLSLSFLGNVQQAGKQTEMPVT